MCLGKVQGVISYPDGPGCIIPHKGKDIQGLSRECIDIWDRNLGNEESESAKSGENGTDDGEMDERSVAEG